MVSYFKQKMILSQRKNNILTTENDVKLHRFGPMISLL